MNVLFILTDQFRFDCLGTLGHRVLHTPNLDALAAESTLFTNTWYATMACAPARASLFTGYYADTHGMGGNQTVLDPPDRKVLPEYLADAGYDTALVGKLHLKPMERTFGFRHLQRHDAPYTNYSAEEAGDSAYIRYLGETAFQHDPQEAVRRFTEDEICQHTDEERFMLGSGFLDVEHHEVSWAVRESIQYLRRERDADKPFFLNCSIFGPHQPYLCPPPNRLSLWRGREAPLRGLAADGLAGAARQPGLERGHLSASAVPYYGYVSMIDEGVGQLLATLREEGLFEETLIVFSADHGEFGGQFRAFYKGLPYEASCHVPLIIRDPRASGGRRCELNTSNIDLFSTILTTAGVNPPDDIESRDLTNLVAGSESGWDNRTVWKKGNQSFLIRDRSKLIRGIVGGHVVYELYDLATDPLEERNLIDDADRGTTIDALRQELDAWHQEQHDKGRARIAAS